MRSPIALLVLGLALPGAVTAQNALQLSLPEAINLALRQNPDLARTGLGIDSGRLREADAATEFRPNLLPEFSSSRFGGESATRLGVRATQKLEWGSVLSGSVGEVHTTSGDGAHIRPSKRIELQQPLFRNYGVDVNREGMRMAASVSLAARRRYELQKADLVLQVAQTYENILRLRQQLQADQEAYKRNDALYRITAAKEGVGKTNRVDTLRVALLRGQAEARVEAGYQRLSVAQRDLATYLGLPLETNFALQPAAAIELEAPSPAVALTLALESRLDYAQALQDYHDARRASRLAGRRTMPDLRLTVSYDDFPTTSTSFGSVPFGQPLWFVGLSVPTEFNLVRERIAIDQARIAEMSAEQALAILKSAIARQVSQQFENYQRALVELKIAESNLDLAARRAKLARALFDVGRGDNFSVTDAEVSLLQAETLLFSARTDASISSYQLSRILGRIVETPVELRVNRVATFD